MSLKIKFNFPPPSTILLFLVLTMVVAIPRASAVRSVMIAGLAIYLLFLMFVNRGPIHWAHAIWTLGFYLLSEISLEWTVFPGGATTVLNNISTAMMLNWSFGEYVYQGKRSFSHMAAMMSIITVLLLGNFLMNSTIQNGRYAVGNNANVAGMSAAYLFAFMFYEAKAAHWQKLHLNICSLVVAVIVVLTGSRKALLLLAVFLIAYFFFWQPEKNTVKFIKRLIIMVSIVLVVVMLLMNVPVLYDSVGNRLESLYLQWVEGENVDASAITREKMIEIGKKMIKISPIIGSGHNTFKWYSGYYTYSHNNYIELMISLGLVGTLLYYLPLAYFLIQALKLWRKGVPGAIVPLVIFLMQFLNDVGQVSYYSFNIHIYLGVAVGYVYLMKKQLREMEAGEEILWDNKGRRLKTK